MLSPLNNLAFLFLLPAYVQIKVESESDDLDDVDHLTMCHFLMGQVGLIHYIRCLLEYSRK